MYINNTKNEYLDYKVNKKGGTSISTKKLGWTVCFVHARILAGWNQPDSLEWVAHGYQLMKLEWASNWCEFWMAPGPNCNRIIWNYTSIEQLFHWMVNTLCIFVAGWCLGDLIHPKKRLRSRGGCRGMLKYQRRGIRRVRLDNMYMGQKKQSKHDRVLAMSGRDNTPCMTVWSSLLDGEELHIFFWAEI